MCEAFSSLGHEVTLFFCRSIKEKERLRETIEDYYGVNLKNVKMESFYRRSNKAINLRIAFMALYKLFRILLDRKEIRVILSRNLYASFVVGVVLKYPLIFETHQLEHGLGKYLQYMLLNRPLITTIVISSAMQKLLTEWVGHLPGQIMVLHDAAPAGIKRLSYNDKMTARSALAGTVDLSHYRAAAGYFGHLYSGRGIEVIQSLASRHPDVAFLIFGGNEDEIREFRAKNKMTNLYFMGYITPSQVFPAMGMMDILLMPYQRSVSIGVPRDDTARWMSPLKMFEYMAVGVPIIASRLPAIEEVLLDSYNCLMAVPDDLSEWSSCLERLLSKNELAERLAEAAHTEYLHTYNWKSRACKILEQVSA